MLLLLIIIPWLFQVQYLRTNCNRLTVEINRPFLSVKSWFPWSTPIWLLVMFEFHERTWLFLQDLKTYHELGSIQISFAEVHSYPKLFYNYRGAK